MLHRRDAMLRLGQVGLGALTLPELLRGERSQAAERPRRAAGTAKSCILVYLWGGPPQQDMWDMKPAAPTGIRSLFRPIHTVVPGIDVCEHMPLFARHTDKTAIVRSLTHSSNIHEASVYHTMTGRLNPGLVSPRNMRRRDEFPNVGSVVSAFSPPSVFPAAVTIPRPIGHDGVTYAGTYGGFLGPRHDPMELLAAPMSSNAPTHGVTLPPNLDEVRLVARRGLLRVLEDNDRALQSSRSTAGFESYWQKAFAMVSSPAAKQACNLDREDPRLRDRYGRNEYGESFLLARRLVEAGVRLVTITWMWIPPGARVQNVWDNHDSTNRLISNQNLPPLDRGFAALMEDLTQRGLLGDTLVTMFGEFGRTPRLNATSGRDHWGMCQSAVFAGGGIRGGQVYGSSDADAAYPKTQPVSPEDVLATIYHAFGLEPDMLLHDQLGRPHPLVNGRPIAGLFA